MDGEPEALSDTGTNCNFASASETLSDNIQAKLDSLEKKAVHLRLVLEKDFKAADIKWSLFVAAAFSFRYESCLRPFPPAFLKNGVKDMDELLSVITDVPALDLVLQQLDNLDNLENISDIIDLLFYVLVRLKEPSLKTVVPESHEAILINAHSTNPAPKPQFIFQVVYSAKSNSEIKWKELSKNHTLFYAYHGNRLEHFYSILNFGLQQHLNKNLVPILVEMVEPANLSSYWFDWKNVVIINAGKTAMNVINVGKCTTLLGNGVHLSPELSVSMPHSYGGFGWGASCIGGHLSCVALCEIIDTPEGINYQRPVSNEGDGHCKDGEEHGDANFDRKYTNYVVTNCDLVRVRYLLVYAKQPASMRFPSSNTNRNGGSLREWVTRHKLFSILLGYGLLLATIGFASNQPVNYYYKMILKKLDVALSNVKV